MDRKQVSLKLEWCQKITEICIAGRSAFPKKWGDKAIPDEEQMLGREDLGALLPVLREHSPWLQGIGETYKTIFGKKDDWYPVDMNGKKFEVAPEDDSSKEISAWRIADFSKRYTLSLSMEALSGIVWCCILRLHPHCIGTTSTRDAVDVWWPIAAEIGKTSAIRKYIGLASAKRVDWENDPAA